LLETEEQTAHYASLLSKSLSAPATVYFSGPIGVGKTTFIRSLIKALGFTGHVKSPTFALVEPYDFWHSPIYHFDLYRVEDPAELELIGIRDFFIDQNICIVEWPEHAQGRLPTPDLEIKLSHEGDHRRIEFCAYSKTGKNLLALIQNEK